MSYIYLRCMKPEHWSKRSDVLTYVLDARILMTRIEADSDLDPHAARLPRHVTLAHREA